MDSLSMILLTIPIFFPVIQRLDFRLSPKHTAIWFGILALIVVEVGLITPPVGMNLFDINAMEQETPIRQTYGVVALLLGAHLLCVALLVAVPGNTLPLLSPKIHTGPTAIRTQFRPADRSFAPFGATALCAHAHREPAMKRRVISCNIAYVAPIQTGV